MDRDSLQSNSSWDGPLLVIKDDGVGARSIGKEISRGVLAVVAATTGQQRQNSSCSPSRVPVSPTKIKISTLSTSGSYIPPTTTSCFIESKLTKTKREKITALTTSESKQQDSSTDSGDVRNSKLYVSSQVTEGNCSLNVYPARLPKTELSSSLSPLITLPSLTKTLKASDNNHRYQKQNSFQNENRTITNLTSLSSIQNKDDFQIRRQQQQQQQRTTPLRLASLTRSLPIEHTLLENSPTRVIRSPSHIASSQQTNQQHEQRQPTRSKMLYWRSLSREQDSSNNNSGDESLRYYSNPVSPASDDAAAAAYERGGLRGRCDSNDSYDEEMLVPSFRTSNLRNGRNNTRRRSSRRSEVQSSTDTSHGVKYSLSLSSLATYSSPPKSNVSVDTTNNTPGIDVSRTGSSDNLHHYSSNNTYMIGNGSVYSPPITKATSMSPTSPVSPPSSGIVQGNIHSHGMNNRSVKRQISSFPASRRKQQQQQHRSWLILGLHWLANQLRDQIFGQTTVVVLSPRLSIRQGSRTWTGFMTLVSSVFVISFFGAYLHTFYSSYAILYTGMDIHETTKLHFASFSSSVVATLKNVSDNYDKSNYQLKIDNSRHQHLVTHMRPNLLNHKLGARETNLTHSSLIESTTPSLQHNSTTPISGEKGTTSLAKLRKVIQDIQFINSADIGNVDDQIHSDGIVKELSNVESGKQIVVRDGSGISNLSQLRGSYASSEKQKGSATNEHAHNQLPHLLDKDNKRSVDPLTRAKDSTVLNQPNTNGLILDTRISHNSLRGRRSHNKKSGSKINAVVSDTDHNDTVIDTFGRFSYGAPMCTPVKADDIEFTLVTQMSMNRLWMMKHHCERWIYASNDSQLDQPKVSIAVYVGNNTTQTSESIHGELVAMGCPDGPVTVQTLSGYSDEEYPVNALRNLALSAVTTSHVVYVDVDFWESSDLHQNVIQHRDFLSSNPKSALVVPAFQLNRQCRDYRECPEKNIPRMPFNKNELLRLMVHRKASSFDPTNTGGHTSTRYTDWLKQPADVLLPIECVNSNRYEPYLVFRYCHDLPPFQEVFTGYGKNKMTWIMQLRYSGYDFHQIGDSFVVHYPHLESRARLKWNGGKDGKQIRKRPSEISSKTNTTSTEQLELQQKYKRAQIDQTFIEFRSWLERQYLNPDDNDNVIKVPKCQNVLNDDERLWVHPKDN